LGIAVAGVDIAHFEPAGATFNGTSPIVSAKIGPNVTQQHVIPAVAPDTLTLNNAAQSLSNKTIVAANNSIVTAPSGGLVATELNAALAELENEIVLKADTSAVTAALALKVPQTSNVGAAAIPQGSTAERPSSPIFAYLRGNWQTSELEFWNGTRWAPVGSSQMYGNAEVKAIFYNSQSIAENINVLAGQNGLSAGPVQVEDGFTVTVANGSVWSVV
jgi:hypothetical protein